MKSRAIIFKPVEVESILEGRKTQTRRRIKHFDRFNGPFPIDVTDDGLFDSYGKYLECPFGAIGDELWVREDYRANVMTYRAGREKRRFREWLPAVSMPRWACRIELRITDLRVERIQEIGIGDIIAEGSTLEEFPALWNSLHENEAAWSWNDLVWVLDFEMQEPKYERTWTPRQR